MLRVFTFFAFLVIARISAFAQVDKTHWVDSVLSTLSVDERIGQLFMRAVPAHATDDQLTEVRNDVKGFDLGGVVFQQENPAHQVRNTNILQNTARIPLLIGQDGEWGVSQSVDSTIHFPRPLVLGAITNDTLVYEMGRETARHMKILGVNLNFASLADVNTNPNDPILSYRSFGASTANVANKITAFVRGMQDNGVIACAKQYSVTGVTITDFNKEVPKIRVTIDSLTSYAFTKLFENNVHGVMPAPSRVPIFYDKVKKKEGFDAATMAHLFTGQWLKTQRKFKGLSFVDLQYVKVVADKSREGDEAVFAFQAGNDVMIGAEDIGAAVRKIRRLIKSDESYEAQLNTSVRKILEAKYDAGLSDKRYVNPDNLIARLNAPSGSVITERLYENAVTVIKNNRKILPITQLDNKLIAYVTSDATAPNKPFYGDLSKYAHASYFTLDEKTDLIKLADALSGHQVVIIGVFPQTTASVLSRMERMVALLKPNVEIVFCDFGNEAFIQSIDKYQTSLTAFCNAPEAMVAASEVLFGAIGAKGRLPFPASRELATGAGVDTKSVRRLRYATPESARMDSRMMARIDSIAKEAIATGATPGMQVIVARGGTVVYERNFGTLNYNKSNPVTSETIYDLASLTKVSATLQAVMFMQERGLIDINKKVSYYLPELKKSNKKDITILEMLTHQAGLAPFIPMWPETVKDTTFLPTYYSRTRNTIYPLQVGPNLYGSMALRDSVWSWIVKSKLIEKAVRTPYAYRYSDLGFLILQRLAEKLLNQPINEFVEQNFYEPLGAYTAGFMPLDRFPKQQIAPTEYDRIFRRALVNGTVHDERGALMGGVAGHAGLFGTATDLTKLGQMLLQEGYYGGYRYYKPETVRLFTNKQFDKSRRGLGWDKPVQSDWNSPTSLKVSPRTFGHTGFTGTCLWVDPEFDLVYVFLSNRVYPDRSGKLISANIRSRIQDVIYDAIFTYCDDFQPSPVALQNPVVSSRR
ncbi:serine hydrolase [Chryseolinea sp. T2]|uniref:serine hydrolase n=1 Tax=Chryseolinea sp. T2 TaxID=3129255 RepID=UPI003076BCDA